MTPRARPADQPRTASIVPPRASADGWDGAERPAHETGLVACAARAADQLLPDPLAGRSCSRCSTGWCAAAPPAARRPLPPATPPHGSPPTAPARLTARAHGNFSPRGRITTSQSLPRCAGTLQLNARRLGSLTPLCRAGVAWHARRGDSPRPSSLFTVTGSVRRLPPTLVPALCERLPSSRAARSSTKTKNATIGAAISRKELNRFSRSEERRLPVAPLSLGDTVCVRAYLSPTHDAPGLPI